VSERVLSERALVMLGDLPPFLRDDPTVQASLQAIADEYDRVQALAEEIRRTRFPQLADDANGFLSQWEWVLGLPVAPSLSVEQRQSIVLAHLRKRHASAGKDWETAVQDAFGGTPFAYTEGPEPYTIHVVIPFGGTPFAYTEGPEPYTIHVVIPFGGTTLSAGRAEALLREITPAHLQIITSYSEGFLIGISRIGIEPIGGTL
jgi:hypothetical protein